MPYLSSGWTFEYGAVCHFESIPMSRSETLKASSDSYFVVETVSDEDAVAPNGIQKNYLVLSMAEAIGLAARLLLNIPEFAQKVIAIRPATEEEFKIGNVVGYYFLQHAPDPISDQHAESLL